LVPLPWISSYNAAVESWVFVFTQRTQIPSPAKSTTTGDTENAMGTTIETGEHLLALMQEGGHDAAVICGVLIATEN
jgi:hypothetical protein